MNMSISRPENISNERMQKLAEKLGKITMSIENEKSSKYDNYEVKIMNLYNSIEEVKENNNKKFNEIKDQILLIQKTTEEETTKRESAHNEFMDYMKRMEEKIFEKFDSELTAKKEFEYTTSNLLEEKINIVKQELQNVSKTRYDLVENLEFYFEKEIPKIQDALKTVQMEREESDNNSLISLRDEIQNENKGREETQEGILEMIKIMNDRMKNDLLVERKEREQNEEVLIELLEGTCLKLQHAPN